MNRIWRGKWSWVVLGCLLVLGTAGIAGWVQRRPLQGWYVLRQLRQADGDAVSVWAEKAADLDDETLPTLLEWLSQDEQSVNNARAALVVLSRRWEREDPRALELANHLIRLFPHLQSTGRRAVFAVVLGWFTPGDPCPPSLAQVSARLLADTSFLKDEELVPEALKLAQDLVRQGGVPPDLLCASRGLARTGLTSAKPEVRVQAIQLAGQPGVDLLDEVVPRLEDPVVEVRRAAMAAVGPAAQVIRTDNLLPWLHDKDKEVRKLCEHALRQRGLTIEHIRLARLITDPRWQVRLEVLDHLEDAADLDAGAWLRRLTHDPAPAVRVAAIRAAFEGKVATLMDRVVQMAQDDPSPTVRAQALYYLRPQQTSMRSHP